MENRSDIGIQASRIVAAAIVCVASVVPTLVVVAPASAASNGLIGFASERSGQFRMYSMLPDGTDVQLIPIASGQQFDWSPDGNRIAYSVGTSLLHAKADGSDAIALGNGTHPDWSPDGTHVAFSNADDIWTVPVTGGAPTRITTDGATSSDLTPRWSPDGSTILYSGSADGDSEIFTVPATGGARTRITTSPGIDWLPDWSPDGSRIAFASFRDGNSEIYTMSTTGDAVVRLTTQSGTDEGPAWSPDGSTIAFSSARDGNIEIYAMGADGSNPTRLTNSPGRDFFPNWQPVPEPPLEITGVRVLTPDVSPNQTFEAAIDLNRTYQNPFDPDEIAVDVTFEAPSGTIQTVPAFWYEDFSAAPLAQSLDPIDDSQEWRVRFTPREVGTYEYTVEARDASASSVIVTGSVVSSPGAGIAPRGFVRVDPENERYLEYDDGTPYMPVGHNAGWERSGTDPVSYYDDLFASFQRADENWTRVWMIDFNGSALEWTGAGYGGLGSYSLDAAWRLDQIVEAAERNGLQMQLVLNASEQFRDRWSANPYNEAQGGPVPESTPEGFFTDAAARDHFEKRLRYIVGRWGASPNILAWELFNEIQFFGTTKNPYNDPQLWADALDWHNDMGGYLKAIDPYDHLVTSSSDPAAAGADVASVPGIDMAQIHDYRSPPADRDAGLSNLITQLQEQHGKPVIVGEFGIDAGAQPEAGPDGTGFDPVNDPLSQAQREHLVQGTHLHNGAWTSAMSGSGGMYWRWDTYIQEDPAKNRTAPDFPLNEHVFPPLVGFFEGESLAEDDLVPADLTSSTGTFAVGLDNGERALVWVRDELNEYGTGERPGDLVGRTISGAEVTLNGLPPGRYEVQVYDPYSTGGAIDSFVVSSLGGSPTVRLDDFQRDVALKISPTSAPASIVVNVTGDLPDVNPGDGLCADTNDDCSLRAAIQESNALTGTDDIDFSIDTGAQTIDLLTALPPITGQVNIDGTSQPGFDAGAAEPVVRLTTSHGVVQGLQLHSGADGSEVRAMSVDGFSQGVGIRADGVTFAGNRVGTRSSNSIGVTAMGRDITIGGTTGNTPGGACTGDCNVISGNRSRGLELSGDVSGTRVLGNFIGVDAQGTAALANGTGIWVEGKGALIGGSVPEARNVISGNAGVPLSEQAGIRWTVGSGDTVVRGNFIGTDSSGMVSVPNGQALYLFAGDGNNQIGGTAGTTPGGGCTGACNVIVSSSTGIEVWNSTDTSILGNVIGLDVTGLAQPEGAPTAFAGIRTWSGSDTIIGGGTNAARNVVSGFQFGIYSSAADRIRGNFIGTDTTGTAGIGNSIQGILVAGTGTVVGGTRSSPPGAGCTAPCNLISGNNRGLQLSGSQPDVRGNFVGTDVSGLLSLANEQSGISGGGSANIGGGLFGDSNVISGNGEEGLVLNGPANTVQGNHIGVGVDGVTPLRNGQTYPSPGIYLAASSSLIGGTNPGEGNIIAYNRSAGIASPTTAGPGNSILGNAIHDNVGPGLQLDNMVPSFPVLTSVVSSGPTTAIQGTFTVAEGPDGREYRLEFFENLTCDPSGRGEGARFLGSATEVVGVAGGPHPFTANLNVMATPGTVLTATVTDPDGSTSEFSECTAGTTDTSAPEVTGVPRTDPNAAGWYSAPVTIDWTATDPAPSSGFNGPSTATTAASRDGLDEIFESQEFCDNAGNCATGEVTLSIDLTPPQVSTIALAAAVPDNATTAFTVTVSDVLSGVDRGEYFIDSDPGVGDGWPLTGTGTTQSGEIPTGLLGGEHTLFVRVRDVAGNWSQVRSQTLRVTGTRELGIETCSLEQDRSEDEYRVQLYDEQGRPDVRLCSALSVDIAEPGIFGYPASKRDPKRPLPAQKSVIPAGTEVRSFLIHADDVGSVFKNGQYMVVSGSVTFSRPVLGIVVTDPLLDQSDVLGASGTLYPTGLANRGTEVGTKLNKLDAITLDDARTTVTFTTQSNPLMDQIRIITEAGTQVVTTSPTSPTIQQVSPPCSLQSQIYELRNGVRLINEQSSSTARLCEAVTADIGVPGIYTLLQPPNGSSSRTIGVGTDVQSHIVHVDRLEDFCCFTPGDFEYFTTTLTFDRDILGIVTSDARLDASDVLGAPGTRYPTGWADRGADFFLGGGNANDESIVLSPDRRSITLTLHVGNGMDEIRVITEAN